MKISAEVEGALSAAEKNDTKIYHPAHNSQTGGALPTIFLAQMAYWWHRMGRKPFYKFVEPCNHTLYKPGESWTEELGIGKTALAGYFQKFGRKLKAHEQGNWRKILANDETLYFVYWTNRSDNLTHWAFNDEAYLKMHLKAYKLSSHADLDGPDADLDGPDVVELSPHPDLPNIIEYTENTQRLSTEEREAQPHISNNGSLSCGGGLDSDSEMDRKQLIGELVKLPHIEVYGFLARSCNWNISLINKSKRRKVHEATFKLWKAGYSDGSPVYTFSDYFLENDWRGKKNGEAPNDPQTVLDCWEGYLDYLRDLAKVQEWCRQESTRTGKGFVTVVKSLDPPLLPKVEYGIIQAGYMLNVGSVDTIDSFKDYRLEDLREELVCRQKWANYFSGKTNNYPYDEE
jgi:hypothetical protein